MFLLHLGHLADAFIQSDLQKGLFVHSLPRAHEQHFILVESSFPSVSSLSGSNSVCHREINPTTLNIDCYYYIKQGIRF